MFQTPFQAYILSMKNFFFITVFLISCTATPATPTVPTLTPAPIFVSSMTVAGLSFPLEFRDPQTDSLHGVPYVDGPAFYRIIGNAIDISSHCFQDPGMYFEKIQVGDTATVAYSNGDTWDFEVVEIIAIRYKSISDPLNNLWIDATGKEYTQRQFFDYVMGRDPGGQYLVLHSSMCDPRTDPITSFGQTFYIAY